MPSISYRAMNAVSLSRMMRGVFALLYGEQSLDIQLLLQLLEITLGFQFFSDGG